MMMKRKTAVLLMSFLLAFSLSLQQARLSGYLALTADEPADTGAVDDATEPDVPALDDPSPSADEPGPILATGEDAVRIDLVYSGYGGHGGAWFNPLPASVTSVNVDGIAVPVQRDAAGTYILLADTADPKVVKMTYGGHTWVYGFASGDKRAVLHWYDHIDAEFLCEDEITVNVHDLAGRLVSSKTFKVRLTILADGARIEDPAGGSHSMAWAHNENNSWRVTTELSEDAGDVHNHDYDPLWPIEEFKLFAKLIIAPQDMPAADTLESRAVRDYLLSIATPNPDGTYTILTNGVAPYLNVCTGGVSTNPETQGGNPPASPYASGFDLAFRLVDVLNLYEVSEPDVSGVEITKKVVDDNPRDTITPPDAVFLLSVTVDGVPFAGEYNIGSQILTTTDGIIRLKDGETAVLNGLDTGSLVEVKEITIPRDFVLNLKESDLTAKTTADGTVISFVAVNHYSPANPGTGDSAATSAWLLLAFASSVLALMTARARRVRQDA